VPSGGQIEQPDGSFGASLAITVLGTALTFIGNGTNAEQY